MSLDINILYEMFSPVILYLHSTQHYAYLREASVDD